MSRTTDWVIGEMEKEPVDLAFEHSQHTDEWLKNCSLCYEDKIATLAKRVGGRSVREVDWDLMSEKSQHPEQNYW